MIESDVIATILTNNNSEALAQSKAKWKDVGVKKGLLKNNQELTPY